MLISQIVNPASEDAPGCANINVCRPNPHSPTNRWISRIHLESQAAHSAPFSPKTSAHRLLVLVN